MTQHNAFTAPRKPVFTEKEMARQRMSNGGKKGGATRSSTGGGVNVATTAPWLTPQKRK